MLAVVLLNYAENLVFSLLKLHRFSHNESFSIYILPSEILFVIIENIFLKNC